MNFFRLAPEYQRIDKLGRLADAAEGKAQLHAHHLRCRIRIDPRRFDLFLGDETVIAAINIVKLRLHLFFISDQDRLSARISRMPRHDHTLTVKHL